MLQDILCNDKSCLYIKNILNWYEFKEKASVLELGSNLGDITVMLSQKDFSKVDFLEYSKIKVNIIKDNKLKSDLIFNVDNISNVNGKYDYILLIGIDKFIDEIYNECNYSIEEKMEKILKFCKVHLNQGGKILLAFDNYLGIRNFSFCQDNGITNIEDENSIKNNFFTKKNVLKLVDQLDLIETNTFYPFPNYRNPDIIFSKKCEGLENNIKNYTVCNFQNSYFKLDENKVLYNILKCSKEYLSIFSNSILMELSNEIVEEDLNGNIRLISFNNERNEKYQLMTIIRDKIVEKIPVSVLAKEHFENIKKNILYLSDLNICNLDYVENSKLYSKYMSNHSTLDESIYINRNDIKYVEKIFNEIKEKLLVMRENYDEKKAEKIISIVGEENKELLKELNFIKYGFWDMVPKNCFYINNQFYFFDQEWMMEYIPVEFIIYRGVINSYEYVKSTNVNELFRKLKIEKFILIFQKIDNYLRSIIMNSNVLNENQKKCGISIPNIIKNYHLKEKEIIDDKQYISSLESQVDMYKMENVNKQDYISNLESENLKLKLSLEKTLKYKIKKVFHNKEK